MQTMDVIDARLRLYDVTQVQDINWQIHFELSFFVLICFHSRLTSFSYSTYFRFRPRLQLLISAFDNLITKVFNISLLVSKVKDIGIKF